MTRVINFRVGNHRIIPFTADFARMISLDGLSEDNLIIRAGDLTPVQLAIAAMLNDIGLVLTASDSVPADIDIALRDLTSSLIISTRDSVETSVSVGASITEALGMILKMHEMNPDLAIQMAENAILRDDLIISADPLQPTSGLSVDPNAVGMVLRSRDGVEFKELRQFLDNLSDKLEIDLQHKVVLIKDYDPEPLGDIDGNKIGHKIAIPFDVALQIALVDGDDGKIDVMLKAVDELGVVVTHPLVIGSIDPKKISELDPEPVPDAITEEI